jgi:hypothetical protein
MTQAELKTHYSAAELAEMKLPSLPGTIQGIGIRPRLNNGSQKSVRAVAVAMNTPSPAFLTQLSAPSRTAW